MIRDIAVGSPKGNFRAILLNPDIQKRLFHREPTRRDGLTEAEVAFLGAGPAPYSSSIKKRGELRTGAMKAIVRSHRSASMKYGSSPPGRVARGITHSRFEKISGANWLMSPPMKP